MQSSHAHALCRVTKHSVQQIAAYAPPCAAKYVKLEQLLSTQQWQAADAETFAMLSATCGLTIDRIVKIGSLSCYDLHTLDSLWLKYSQRRFGLSVQQRLWRQVCGQEVIEVHNAQDQRWMEFCHRVGWSGRNEAAAGHFPSKNAVSDRAAIAHPEVFTRLYRRFEICQSV